MRRPSPRARAPPRGRREAPARGRSRWPSRPGPRRAARPRARRPRRRSRSSRRPRRRHRARAPTRRPRRLAELEAGDLGPRARNPSRRRPPRPTRSPGWRAERSRGAQVGIFERPSRPLAALLLAALREVSNGFSARSPALPGSFPARVLAGPEGLVDALLRPPRGARQQEREDREDDAHGDDYGDGQVGLPSLATGSQLSVPAAPGAKTGHESPPVDTGRAARRLRAPVPARRAADVRRGLLRLRPTSSTGPRRVLGLVFVGELLGAGQLDWTWWQNLLAIAGAVAFVCAGDRGRERASRGVRRARSRSGSAGPSWRPS